ncbi:MAG TPA: TIGR03118 family protein, partial [Crenalkalicoccus sp.]|nr:TIGR03118 family protein [Crenalkalicoccus sp.]
ASGQGFTVTAFGKAADAAFLFDSEDGTITGWTPGVDPAHAVLAVDNSDSGAVYKGLAIGNDGTQSLLYAANFHSGKVEVYDHDFQLVNRITDASLPKDYAPFGVQVLGDHLFVTYAKQDAAGRDDVAGKGHGFVDEFNLDGTLVQRVASHGPLDSPWGVSLAPESWGALAGDLLVGNFGDGTILAYNLSTGTFDGKLRGADGAPLHIDGLWGLIPGNGGLGGDPAKIYFTAGVDDEAHGLFGSLAVHTDALLA